MIMVRQDKMERKEKSGFRAKIKDAAPAVQSVEETSAEPCVPLASDARMATDLKLLSKEKDLLDAEESLEETKHDVQRRLDAVGLRRDFLRNKEKQHFTSLLAFEDLLLKIDADWTGILKQINAEHSIQEQRIEEASEMRSESDVAARKRGILKGFMQKYEPSRVFMLNVVNLSEDYENVKDVSDDYICLQYAYEELSETEAVLQKKMDANRKRKIKFSSVRSDHQLAHDIFVEVLSTFQEQIKVNMVNLGDEFFSASEKSLVKKMDVGRIHMGIEHMFRLVCKKQTFVLKHPGCHLEMMKWIGEFIDIWTDVVKEVRQFVAEQKRQRRRRRLAYEKRKPTEDLAT